MTRIKLKNSTVLNKAPTAADIEIGELAINANVGSPGAYIKDTDDNIIKIAGSGVGETPDLQAVLETGHVTYGESIQLNQADGGGAPFPVLQVSGSLDDTSGSVFVRGGTISVESGINDAFEVGNYLGNNNYDWNFKCDYQQASFAKPLTIIKQLIGPQGTGSAGGTEINLDAETGKVTLYDTSPIGGTPKTVLWELASGGLTVGSDAYNTASFAVITDSQILGKAPSTDTNAYSIELGAYTGFPNAPQYYTNIRLQSDGRGDVSGLWEFHLGKNPDGGIYDSWNELNKTTIEGSSIYIVDQISTWTPNPPTAHPIAYEQKNFDTQEVLYSWFINRQGTCRFENYDLEHLPALP